jgi:hypothetical protein
MFKEMKFSSKSKNRFWLTIVISSMVILTAACGNSAATQASPTTSSASVPPTSESVAVPTQVSSSAGAAAEACTLLTKEDVSKAIGITVDKTESKGLGGVCTYTAGNYSIDFTIAGHTGGIKAMNSTLTSLGDLALVVPGLGDQAFYNTNSASALFLLKGDAEYMFSISSVDYQPLDAADVQAKEKAMAEQLLSNLP